MGVLPQRRRGLPQAHPFTARRSHLPHLSPSPRRRTCQEAEEGTTCGHAPTPPCSGSTTRQARSRIHLRGITTRFPRTP